MVYFFLAIIIVAIPARVKSSRVPGHLTLPNCPLAHLQLTSVWHKSIHLEGFKVAFIRISRLYDCVAVAIAVAVVGIPFVQRRSICWTFEASHSDSRGSPTLPGKARQSPRGLARRLSWDESYNGLYTTRIAIIVSILGCLWYRSERVCANLRSAEEQHPRTRWRPIRPRPPQSRCASRALSPASSRRVEE